MPTHSINIEKETLKNNNYRKVLYTNKYQQLVVMSIQKGEFIPWEIHNGSQFFRIESGKGTAKIKIGKDKYKNVQLKDGQSLIVPPNTKHLIKNTGIDPLKLYTIYSPPQHKDGIVQRRFVS